MKKTVITYFRELCLGPNINHRFSTVSHTLFTKLHQLRKGLTGRRWVHGYGGWGPISMSVVVTPKVETLQRSRNKHRNTSLFFTSDENVYILVYLDLGPMGVGSDFYKLSLIVQTSGSRRKEASLNQSSWNHPFRHLETPFTRSATYTPQLVLNWIGPIEYSCPYLLSCTIPGFSRTETVKTSIFLHPEHTVPISRPEDTGKWRYTTRSERGSTGTSRRTQNIPYFYPSDSVHRNEV